MDSAGVVKAGRRVMLAVWVLLTVVSLLVWVAVIGGVAWVLS